MIASVNANKAPQTVVIASAVLNGLNIKTNPIKKLNIDKTNKIDHLLLGMSLKLKASCKREILSIIIHIPIIKGNIELTKVVFIINTNPNTIAIIACASS